MGPYERKVNRMPIATTLPITVPPRRPNISVIPAVAQPVVKPIISGYARVSRIESGLESLENQIIHLEEAIHADPSMTPGRVYHDQVSGREAHNRPGLQALLADCRAGKCQIVLVKSISRLARSTPDLLTIVREMMSIGVVIIFERERIRTDQMASEFLLTVLATFAANESDNIGSSVRWGHRSLFQLGKHKVFNPPYGFDAKDGRLVINTAEAEIVKEIYTRFLAGEGGTRIAKDLQSRGIPTKRGGRWHHNTVLGIVKNPACYGTIVNQKTYRDGGKVHTNRGELEMYVQEGQSPGIVDEGAFNRVQDLLAGRREHYNTFRIEEDEENVWFRLQRTCFSSHIFCNQCGSVLHRSNQYKSGPDVDPLIGKGWTWKCSEHAKDSTLCSMTPIKEVDITRAFLNMVNKLVYSMSTDLPLLDLFIEALLGDEEDRNAEVLERLSDELQKIEYERQSAIDLASHAAIAPAAFRAKMNSLERREGEIKVAKTKLEWSHAVQETEKVKTLLSEPFQTAGSNHSAAGEHSGSVMTAFDEVLFAGIVERVVVQAKQFITFELKCGLKFTEYFAELDNASLGGPVISNAAGSSASSLPWQKREMEEQSGETAPFKLPYGYKRVDGKIEVEPTEAEQLRLFFKLLAEGKSIDTAGLAAGIPRKGSGLYKIAHRKAYAGTSIYPSIIDSSLVRIKNNEGRRMAFVPLYSDFEFGMIPEIDQNLSPAECIGVLFHEIKPVSAFQPGVADFPTRRDVAGQPAPTTEPPAPTIPITAFRSVCTPSADVHTASAAAPATDHKGDAGDFDAQRVDAEIFVPVARTSPKRRVVDLAIEMHNRRMAGKSTAPGGLGSRGEPDTSVAPAPIPVKSKFEVTVTGATIATPREDKPAPAPAPRRPITITISPR